MLRPKLGIVAGGGDLPMRLIAACRDQGRDVFVLALTGAAEERVIAETPHSWVRPGAVGQALEALRAAHVTELVLAGHVRRPSLPALRPDATGAKLLARLGKAFFAGDDTLLSALIAYLEEEGFRVLGAEDILQDTLAPEGVLGRVKPGVDDMADIALGIRAARELGERDIGQAVVIRNGEILGREDAEGTDALLSRVSPLRQEMLSGVLVKAKKPQQERRADLPSIGPLTVSAAHRAGLAGIAVEAGHALIIDREELIRQADAVGLFVMGFRE